MKHKKLTKNKLPLMGVVVISFAFFAVFGFNYVSVNDQSSVGTSLASAQEPADINSDSKVDIVDLSILLSNWNTTDNLSDVNNDNIVDIVDLSILLSKWGAVSGNSPYTISSGAKLPISYDISSLSGTKRYVATNGNDSTGNGTVGAPFATIKKAEAVSANGDSIVVRGGTYGASVNAVTIDRSNLTLIAYPGEVPVFDGSIAAPVSANPEGSMKYFSYQPMPAAIGEGLGIANLPTATFSGTTPTGQAAERGWRCVTGTSTYTIPGSQSGSDPDGCGSSSPKVITGYYPDQVWVNGTALVQVLDKNKVGPGKFWINRTSATDASPGATNLYLSATDAADMSKVRVSSSNGYFVHVAAPNVKLAGFKIINNSPIWSKSTVLLNNNYTTLENISIESNASGGIKIARGNSLATLATGNALKNVTVTKSGWTGMVLYYNNDTTLESVLFDYNEPHLEFYSSPQRGAIKATKSHRTKILNSAFENNGMGVWFDQSNYDADIVGNRFVNNSDSSVFYEISHGLTLANNYINGHGSKGATIRLAGASDLKIINNTIIGGRDVIWMGTDARSKKFTTSGGEVRDCSEHTRRYGQGGDSSADCWVGYSSDFDIARPGAYSPTGEPNLTLGMDWNNSFTIFMNNIIADSNSSNQCGSTVPLCVNAYINWNSSQGLIQQQVDLRTIFPSTLKMNGNLYQSSTDRIATIRTDWNVSQPGGFAATDLDSLKGPSGFGSAFYGLNVESNGLYATSGLVDTQGIVSGDVNHSNAAPAPNDADVNKYINSGTKHYGAIQ